MKFFLLSAGAVAATVAGSLAAGDSWNIGKGNACGDLAGCKCESSTCKDVPGQLHYLGVMNSSDACEATCTAAGAANCSIWLWSETSKHCFWRLDGTWDPDMGNQGVISGCLESSGDPSVQCIAGCGSCGAAPAPAPGPKNYSNMNGFYNLSNTPGSDVSKFPSTYRSYPGQPEYFEVYSPPIVSLYSQVYWTRLPTIDLPRGIVERFKDKTMAVVGFEMDQVRRTPDGDVRVPINVAYNHHFESTMTGNGAQFERIEVTDPNDPRLPPFMGHRRPNESEAWIVVPDPAREASKPNGIPSSVGFGAANGGEYRKSFHGYAPGYANLIHSPEQFSITPMQIDTWNRDKMSITGGPFVPGPVPRTSLAPIEGPDAIYSGLLECPVTTRLRKEMTGGSYEIQVKDVCSSGPIATAPECFQASSEAHFPPGTNFTFKSESLPASPAGCIAFVDDYDGPNASVSVVFNTASPNATAACGAASGDPADLVAYGEAQSLVRLGVTVDTPKDVVTINVTGPADVWFGVGFNATQMKDGPWAIIVEPSSGATSPAVSVTERKLADQNPGTQLASSVTVESSTVDTTANKRTLVLTRKLQGATADHFTFSAADDVALSFINAVGSGPALSYHKDKTAAQIALLPLAAAGDGMCICAVAPPPFGSGTGTLEYSDGSSVGCCNHCEPEPRSDMMAMQNPTCDIRTYAGGQLSCHHMWSLLDADQDIPWQDQPLNYSLKFRFWFEEYNATGGSVAAPAIKQHLAETRARGAKLEPIVAKEAAAKLSTAAPSHIDVGRTTWGIASPVEFDVPKCDNKTMGCELVDGTWVHTIKGTFPPSPSNIKLVAAHFHCHAPTCLSVTIYDNTTGEVICEERPIYGGSGLNTPGFDEAGFITQPPCLWGDAAFGLSPPPSMQGRTLHAVKTSNATYGHHGEMAWMQMFYIQE